MVTPGATWSAPVRYAEVDQQGIVFNSHYLTYCDEAMAAFCVQRGLLDFAARVHLVTATVTWRASARWGDVIDVTVACTRLGRTSTTMTFDLHVGDRQCCTVETVYVLADGIGTPVPMPEDIRAALQR